MAEELKSATAQHAEGASPEALTTEVCLDLPIAPADSVEIYRYLGYPQQTAPRRSEQISEIVSEALKSLHPRGAYAVYKVCGQTAHSLKLSDISISGNIGDFLEDAGRVAVFAVTVGEETSRLAEAVTKSGDAFSAWVIDATGSWAAEAAADALMLRIGRHLHDGEGLTLRYSPGYCGMELGEQRKLFQLVQANAVGVTLMPSMLMHPLKSISGLVGLAPMESVSRYHSPCDLCPRTGCHMRR